MNDQLHLSLTPAQLEVYLAIQKNKMAWLTLRVVLACFALDLGALIFAAFSPTAGPSMRWAFGLIDGLLGWAIHRVIGFLFPK